MIGLAEIEQIVKGELRGSDLEIDSFSIDGRHMPPKGMFVALKGERVDGHDYVEQAVANGAVAVMLERDMESSVPTLLVKDARIALVELAKYWRNKFIGKLIAITGSNGKTTVKEMVASIMRQCGLTLATAGNLNNELGVPLTLLRLQPQSHQYAVIEMGANHVGEIKYLCQIAKPDISLINNVGAAHLEGFGSIEDIVVAKSEIYHGLKEDGIAVINADDPHKKDFIANAQPHRMVQFSVSQVCDLKGEYLGASDSGKLQIRLSTKSEETEVLLPLLGLHNVNNAVAAAAVASVAGASLLQIKQGLESASPVPGRLNVKKGLAKTTVIDDTYNANPSSCAVALDALALFKGKKIFVLGDMGELGDDALVLHEEVGKQAREKNVDEIFCLGSLSHAAAKAFPEGQAHKYAHYEDLLEDLWARSVNGDLAEAVILVKGSRFMKMERVVHGLTERENKLGDAGPLNQGTVTSE